MDIMKALPVHIIFSGHKNNAVSEVKDLKR